MEQKNLFDRLIKLYENNGYYYRSYQSDLLNNRINRNFTNQSTEVLDKTIKPLRTVVNRSVEFYVSKVSSAMQISSNQQEITDAINQFLTWSNFSAMKPVSLRNMTLFGNVFFKINANKSKVYAELIDPRYITDLKLDTRGYITEIRIDIPVKDDNNNNLTFTEYWTKEYFSTWTHQMGANAELDTLGTPDNSGWLAELGINFIPIVQIKFKDVGDAFGVSCVNHALDKIEESNRQASRLSDILFRYNKATIAVTSTDKDSLGRPIPTSKIPAGKDIFDPNDESIIYLNNGDIKSLIPDIDYNSALNILNAMMDEIKQDLPELNYYSMKDGNLSGKAIKLLLASAIDRANEAQSNFLQGMKRVCEIALTLGSFWHLFNLNGTSYETGYDFEIIVEDMFPMDDSDKATLLKSYTDAGLALNTTLKMLGFGDEFIKNALADKQAETEQQESIRNQSLGNALQNFNAGV